MNPAPSSERQRRLVASTTVFALGLIALFLPWYSVSLGAFGDVATNGLGSSLSNGSGTLSWFPVNWLFVIGLLLVGMAVYILMQDNMGTRQKDWRRTLGSGATLELAGALGYMVASAGSLGAYSSYGSVGFGLVLGVLVAIAGILVAGGPWIMALYPKQGPNLGHQSGDQGHR